MSRPWPASPLQAAQRAFEFLTCPPAPLAFDCRGIPHLPQHLLPLDDLRRALTNPNRPISRPVADAVWREIVTRARRDGPAWKVAAVGLALPGLTAMAGMLTTGWRGDTADLDAELLTGFLERLTTVNLDDCRILGKLIDAGERAAKKSRDWVDDGTVVRIDGAWSIPPQHPWDHPDWVLARAVSAAIIGPEESLLIGETRLGEIPLQVVADKLGVAVTVAATWRRKAEKRLVEAITEGHLSGITLDASLRRAAIARNPLTIHGPIPHRPPTTPLPPAPATAA